MRSRLEIVAEYRAGRTVVSRVEGGGHFAARLTGAGEVHLVGTAAGPLGGDEATIVVRVAPGARLTVRSAGATIIQPGLTDPASRLNLELQVGEGAHLSVEMEPTVVCAAAAHEAVTTARLEADGQLRLLENVVLGRSGEPGGAWIGRLAATRGSDVPIVRHTLCSRLVSGVRVISMFLDTGATAEAATSGDAVAMPLAAGGLLATATGATLLPTRADLAEAIRSSRKDLSAATAGG